MNDKETKPRGSVDLEECPEEMFTDLLPYEMERAEFIMGSFFKDHKTKLVKSIEKNAESDNPVPVGKKDWDRVRDEGAKMDEINASITTSREKKVNGWGHHWRASPTVEAEHYSKSDAKLDMHPELQRAPFPPDPILDKAVLEYKETAEHKARTEAAQQHLVEAGESVTHRDVKPDNAT